MELNEVKYGFKLVSIKDANDIGAKLYEYEHLKSGAKLAYLENDDTNCCFAIGFRTLPNDSTGVCHIIEHSVLCGSDKYPLKEPFVNLLKSSMQTFLNAFTANDWTMYPFASATPADYNNILSIYLDAVFNPLSIKDNKPFLQEGWHYELLNEEATPSIKGVVYNEMKGAMSSVDEVLQEATLNAMYEGTSYGVNSGGDPDVIPTLTYEAYKDFHKKHYTPQNALTYLYGKLDILEKLKFIDENYFSKYEKTNDEIIIEAPKALINKDYEIEYEIGEDEDVKNNTYMSLSFGLDYYKNIEELTAWQILNDALFSDNNSPLKKALMDAKLGNDVGSYIDDDKIKPAFIVTLEKTNKNKKEEFYNTFISAVKNLVENGIDKDILIAAINHAEFKSKELETGGFPKGLVLVMGMMGSFNYRNDLIETLEFMKHYEKFKAELNNGYFEKLLEKYILNSKHYVLVVAKPSKTLGTKKKKAMDKAMADLKASMSKAEIKALVKQTNDLIAYQNHTDTKAELKTLPSLSLKNIPTTINWVDSKKAKVNGYNVLTHELNTNKIGYLRMYFNLETLSTDDLYYVPILSRVLTRLATKKYSAIQLQNKIKTYLGDFTVGTNINPIDKNNVISNIKLSASVLAENASYLPELISEVLLHTKFNAKEVKLIITQMVNEYKMTIMGNGMGCAMQMASSSTSTFGVIGTILSPSPISLEFMNNLVKENDIKSVIAKLKEISKLLFTKKNSVVSLTGDLETISTLKEVLKNTKLPSKKYETKLELKVNPLSKKALIIPAGVSYSGMSTNLEDINEASTGALAILAHIVRYDYLWSEVRVKGGAYGASISVDKANNVSLGSYRDPNVLNTYNIFNALPNYLKSFNPNKDEYKNYIIGAVGKFDQPLSASMAANLADLRYFSNVTKKDLITKKKQMLSTKVADINNYADVFEKLLINNAKYTIGNEAKINEANIFDEIKNI